VQLRYKLFAVAIVLCIATVIAFSVRAPTGVSLTFLGYRDDATSRDRLWFVVTNDSTRPVHLSGDSPEFRTAHGWYLIGPAINLSGQDIVSERDIGPGETLRFCVIQPGENLAWRVSIRWCSNYNQRWWRIQQRVDLSLRRLRATPWFMRWGVLKGPELPPKPLIPSIQPTAASGSAQSTLNLHESTPVPEQLTSGKISPASKLPAWTQGNGASAPFSTSSMP
jgi:hypothetical protein